MVRVNGQKSLAGYSPWGHKESDTTEQLSLSIYTKRYDRDIDTYMDAVHADSPGKNTGVS